MSQASVRIAVPPRELASTVTAKAVLRAGWAIAYVYLAIAAAVVSELWISHPGAWGAAIALAALAAVVAALIFLMLKPSRVRGTVYLAVGALSGFVYDYVLLLDFPDLNDHGTYLLNRITVALLLIGAVGLRLINGIVWCTIGCVLGSLATMAAQLLLGFEPKPGFGPIASLTIYVVILAMFVLIRRSQRKFVPDFSAVEAEAARMAGQRELEERAVALLHDTVLNDLTFVASGKDELDERQKARLLNDIDTVMSAPADVEPSAARGTAGELRDKLLAVMSDFRWRGLTLDVSGGEALLADLAPDAAQAIVGAVTGCLENIVQHAGTATAEIFIDSRDGLLSLMIVDHGKGFDPESIPKSRLGIRRSIVQRVTNVGGSVRIWSSPNSGTSVIIAVPLGSHDE